MKASQIFSLNELVKEVHANNVMAGWWTDLETGERKDRNVGELLMLIVSEVSESMEGYRKNLMDDKLPHRSMFEAELADVIIRVFDLAGAYNLNLGGTIYEKLEYNKTRLDHQIASRKLENGKKF